MPAHAKITKSRSKKKPFKVVIIAENGESLNVAQLFTTAWNCRKNLIAVMKAFSGTEILVKDFSGKDVKEFSLHNDGLQKGYE